MATGNVNLEIDPEISAAVPGVKRWQRHRRGDLS
jgi:hypothetical protein